MHHIYHTHGFVLSSKNMGEANKMLTIYTKEMGLIRAMVQGVRLNKSKLRFALQDFFYAKIDFVRGKDIWRITSATTLNSFPFLRKDKSAIILTARISKLLERLCDQEEKNEEIFNDLINAIYLLDNENIDENRIKALEIFLVFKIMYYLGYIGDSDVFSKYTKMSFDQIEINEFMKDKNYVVSYINKVINESHL